MCRVTAGLSSVLVFTEPRHSRGGVRRVNGAEASDFDADGINRKTILFFTGFPSKLENDGAGRRRPLVQ